MQNFIGFLVPEKPNDPIPRKQPNRQQDGRSLFHGTHAATARGLTSLTTVDWHLKVKDIEYDVHLTKLYCLTARCKKSVEFTYSFFK